MGAVTRAVMITQVALEEKATFCNDATDVKAGPFMATGGESSMVTGGHTGGIGELSHDNDNLLLDRLLFLRCKQSQGDSFENWWIEKEMKAKVCNWDDATPDDFMKLKLVRSVRDPRL